MAGVYLKLVMESVIIVLILIFQVNCCKDEPACAQYFKKPKPVDLCTYKTTAKWFQEHCKKSCNLCHLYTTSAPTKRTFPTFPMKNCGSASVPSSRVIDGVNSTKGEWPWQIALHYKGRFLCGGSVVSPYWIVTAAHCLTFKKAQFVTVVLGEYNRQVDDTTEQKYGATRILIHGGYTRPVRKANDIGLIKLDKPIKMTKYIQRVCLPKQGQEPKPGTKCFITGWGKMKHPGGPATILQKAPLEIVNNTECRRLNSGLRVALHDSMLCAGNTKSRKSGCHGDSGGPFVCQDETGRWFLHGVVSWGSPTCNSRHGYSVFSKVSYNRNWLDRYIWY